MRYHFFRLVSVFAPRIPWRLRPFVATLVGLMAWLLARSARAGASQNAMHVLGLTNTETRQQRRRLRRVVQGMFITAARNYLEVCAFSDTSPQQLLSHLMPNPDFSALDAALAPGKGAILISAHFGPFDYVAQCLQLHGYPLTIPVEQLSDQRMLDLMLSLRRRYGVQYVPLHGASTMRTLLQQLRERRMVLITADRVVQGSSVEVPFFNTKARLPLGPIALALHTGTPLVGAFGWYGRDQRIYGALVPITLSLPEERRSDPEAIIRVVVQLLEDYIGTYPQQWAMFTPIWLE